MRLRGFLIIGAVLSIIVGYFLGKAVMGDAPVPGSAEDPLVSKSYADKAILERVTDLEKTVAELTVQAQVLQNTVNEVQSKVNTTSSSTPKPVTTPTPTPIKEEPEKKTEPDPVEPPQTSESLVGKTLYISTQNYANLRSAPTLEADVVLEVKPGAAMVVQKEENGWYNVKLDDGTVGWIFNSVVKL